MAFKYSSDLTLFLKFVVLTFCEAVSIIRIIRITLYSMEEHFHIITERFLLTCEKKAKKIYIFIYLHPFYVYLYIHTLVYVCIYKYMISSSTTMHARRDAT